MYVWSLIYHANYAYKNDFIKYMIGLQALLEGKRENTGFSAPPSLVQMRLILDVKIPK